MGLDTRLLPGDGFVQHASAPEPRRLRLAQILGFLVLLYLFLCSIELLGGSFKLMGKGFAEALLETTSNPFVGLMVGVLATSLVQSSSTVTSLIVGLVAAEALSIEAAVPMVMGANIGTSITNTIVAMGHLTRSQEFQRAFSGATVHDFFNILAVVLLLPLQITTGFLSRSALFAERFLMGQEGVKFKSPLKFVVQPTVELIEDAVLGLVSRRAVAATIVAVLALGLLFFSLNFIVKLMKRLLLGKMEILLHRYIFSAPWRGMLVGTVVTMLVQSSSVTTSLTVPLLAAGFVTIEQIFPFILGANVGTTITALLASMVTGSAAALTVALCHLFFNVYGILFLYPLRRLPIGAARWLGRMTRRSRVYAFGYILVVFFLIPLSLILLTR